MFKVNGTALRKRGEELKKYTLLYNLGRKSDSREESAFSIAPGWSHTEVLFVHKALKGIIGTAWLLFFSAMIIILLILFFRYTFVFIPKSSTRFPWTLKTISVSARSDLSRKSVSHPSQLTAWLQASVTQACCMTADVFSCFCDSCSLRKQQSWYSGCSRHGNSVQESIKNISSIFVQQTELLSVFPSLYHLYVQMDG